MCAYTCVLLSSHESLARCVGARARGGRTGRQGMFRVRGHPWAVGSGGWRKEAPGEVNMQTEQENLRRQSQGRDQQRGREDGVRGQSARLVDKAGKVYKIQGISCTLAPR